MAEDVAATAADVAEDVADAAGDALEVAADVAGDVADVAADVAEDVAEGAAVVASAVAEGAKAAAPHIAEGAKVAVQGAAIGMAYTKVAFGAVSDALKPASDALIPALAAAGVAAKSLWDVVKFEIFRDFFQIVSLFFAGLKGEMPKAFDAFYGKVSEFMSICFSCWIKEAGKEVVAAGNAARDFKDENADTIALIVLIVKTLVAFIAALYFYHLVHSYNPDEDQQGLETVSWADQSAKRNKIVKYAVLVITSLYLPVSQDAFMLMVGHHKYATYKGTGLTIWAIVILLVYVVPAPIVLYKAIQSNKPEQSLYDAEGKVRTGGYTDQDYKDDLKKDFSPFKSLYDPYERRWAGFKVIVMMIKLVLVLPVVILTTESDIFPDFGMSRDNLLLVQSIVTSVVILTYCCITTLTRPFIDNADDWLDGISRYSTLIISVLGLISAQLADENGEESNARGVLGIFLTLVTSLSVVIAGLFFISTNAAVKKKIKNCKQRLDLTPAREAEGPLLFSSEYSPARERKLRIWHEFWDLLIKQDSEYQVPKDEKASEKAEGYVAKRLGFVIGSTPPYLPVFEGTIGERHEENKEIAAKEGVRSYASMMWYAMKMHTDPAYESLRNTIQQCIWLNGIDVYFDGKVEGKADGGKGEEKQRTQKAQSCPTGFGKMYVVPFPLTVVMAYDEGGDMSILSPAPGVAGVLRDPQQGLEELYRFVARNNDPEILRRKDVRMICRCMNGEEVNHWFQKWKTKTKQRTVTKTNAEGESVTTTESYTVRVLFTFNRGTFGVAQNSKKAMWTNEETGEKLDLTAGFKCTIHYTDGTGVDHEGKHWTNEHETIGHSEIGISNEYAVVGDFARLLRNNWWNRPDLQAKKPVLQQKYHAYREHIFGQYLKHERALSYAFWFYVYNNDAIRREDLASVLALEHNDLLKGLPAKHKDDLDMVFSKIMYFNSHPAAGLWFSFWHDVWIHNKDMKILQDDDDQLKKSFSPFESDAIMYNPMKREVLEAKLSLEDIPFGKKFLKTELLDTLFEKLDALIAAGDNPNADTTIEITPGDDVDVATPVVRSSDATDARNQELLVNVVQNYQFGSDFFRTRLEFEPVQAAEIERGEATDADNAPPGDIPDPGSD